MDSFNKLQGVSCIFTDHLDAESIVKEVSSLLEISVSDKADFSKSVTDFGKCILKI